MFEASVAAVVVVVEVVEVVVAVVVCCGGSDNSSSACGLPKLCEWFLLLCAALVAGALGGSLHR